MPRLSVIIPTRDRPDVLGECLATIQAQDVAPELMEVIVVDDGSSQELAPVVTRSRGPIAIRCERQPPAGLNAARNRGIFVTTGELVAFLDDDTLLDPGWARAMIDTFDASGCSGVGGRVELRFEAAPPRWLSKRQRDYLAEFDLGPAPRWLDSGPVPVGADCAVRRSELERVGGFRPGLDREGRSLVSNGDTEFFRRLRSSGGRLRYAPGARVLHRIPAERLTSAFFRRRAYAQGISDVLLAGADQGGSRSARLAREFWRWGRTVPILARGIATGRGPMNAVQWMSYCRGRFDATKSGHH